MSDTGGSQVRVGLIDLALPKKMNLSVEIDAAEERPWHERTQLPRLSLSIAASTEGW
jgi:hypothetical protein